MNAALGFMRAFRPKAGEFEALDAELEIAPAPPGTAPVKLDLIALYRRKDSTVTALAFRPESFADKVEDSQVGWSGINSSSKRAALVLGHVAHPTLRMELYSGADGATYEYLPSQQAASLPNELDKLKQQHAALARSDFTTDATHPPYESSGSQDRLSSDDIKQRREYERYSKEWWRRWRPGRATDGPHQCADAARSVEHDPASRRADSAGVRDQHKGRARDRGHAQRVRVRRE
jgi:hypothetical protein